MEKITFSPEVLANGNKIVDMCMGQEEAFCKSRCPMNTDVLKYVNLIGARQYDEAIRVIREQLFLPNTLGRICAHPCEENCRRQTEFKQPIAIAALKRFAAEKADHEANWNLDVKASTGKKVAIVGAGPAGAQAAIYLRRIGHDVTIYEKLNVVGGMMRIGIPAYRLPRDVIDYEYSYLTKLGVTFKFGVEIGKDISLKSLRDKYDAVLLAHGAHLGNIIKMPGSEAIGVYPATEYLKEISLNGSFSNVGKKVMVIGGGDVAMDCARSSFRIGVTDVYQCSLEDLKNLPASTEEVQESLEEGVQFNAGFGPIEIITENNKVKGIKIQEIASIYDEQCQFNPQYVGEPKVIEVDTIIMATGQVVEDITEGAIAQKRAGRYEVDHDTLATSLEDVFVAGDAAGSNIVVEAMALGQKAAISIERFLSHQDLAKNRDFVTEWSYETKLNVPLPEGVTDVARIHPKLREANERKFDFMQVDLGLSEDDAVKEASRCLSCSCQLCMKECIMMNDFGACPKELMEGLVNESKMEALLAYSCNACDNCTIVCPLELPMKQVFIGARKDFVKANKGESPMKGHSSIKMHQLLGFSKLFTTKIKGGEKS